MSVNLMAVRIAMCRQAYNPKKLASVSGIGQCTIQHILSGKQKNYRPETLGRLANALGVDVTEIVSFD